MPVNTRIQLRRGTAAAGANQWVDQVLAAGEVGFESDTGKFKIGDGTTAWNSLGYASVLPSELSELVDDRLNGLLVAGNNISLTYDDEANTLIIATDALDAEEVQDAIGTKVVGGSGISVSYDDGTGVTTVSLSDPTIQLEDITDLDTDIATFLATPTSTNLRNAVDDAQGSGDLVFHNNPTLISPTINGDANFTDLSILGDVTFDDNVTIGGTGTISVIATDRIGGGAQGLEINGNGIGIDIVGGGTGNTITIGGSQENVNLSPTTADSLTVQGNTTLNSVSGTTTINGATTLSSSLDVTGLVNLNSTQGSTSVSTGALVVDGGVGIAEKLYVGNTATISSGGLNVTGATIINGTLYASDDFSISDKASISSVGAASFASNVTVGGTLGVTGNTTLSGTLGVTGVTTITNTTDSTNKDNGSLVVKGGVGIDKSLNVYSGIGGADHYIGEGGVSFTGGLGGVMEFFNSLGKGSVDGSDAVFALKDDNGSTVVSMGLRLGDGTANFNYNTGSTSDTTGAVVVAGGVGIGENLYVGGNLDITGDTTLRGDLTVVGTTNSVTVESTVVTVQDPVFTLAKTADPLTINDGLDKGIEFHYYDTEAKLGFFGWDNDQNRYVLLENATNTNEVFSGSVAVLDVSRITGTASAWTTGRTITLSGDVTGSVSNVDGSNDITITTTVTGAGTVTIVEETADTDNYITFANALTGDQAVKTDSVLRWNAADNKLIGTATGSTEPTSRIEYFIIDGGTP